IRVTAGHGTSLLAAFEAFYRATPGPSFLLSGSTLQPQKLKAQSESETDQTSTLETSARNVDIENIPTARPRASQSQAAGTRLSRELSEDHRTSSKTGCCLLFVVREREVPSCSGIGTRDERPVDVPICGEPSTLTGGKGVRVLDSTDRRRITVWFFWPFYGTGSPANADGADSATSPRPGRGR
ncbi:MAG: hypothetical protein BJ554DRAFT_3386, partial [Olpidium bornovanus]